MVQPISSDTNMDWSRDQIKLRDYVDLSSFSELNFAGAVWGSINFQGTCIVQPVSGTEDNPQLLSQKFVLIHLPSCLE